MQGALPYHQSVYRGHGIGRLSRAGQTVVHLLRLSNQQTCTSVTGRINLSRTTIQRHIQQLLSSRIVRVITIASRVRVNCPHTTVVTVGISNSIRTTTREVTSVSRISCLISATNKVSLLTRIFTDRSRRLCRLLGQVHTMRNMHRTRACVCFGVRGRACR